MEAIHTKADGEPRVKEVITESDSYFTQKKEKIKNIESLVVLDGLILQMISYKDDKCKTIEIMLKPKKIRSPKGEEGKGSDKVRKENIRSVYRQAIFPSKTLKTEEEVNDYVENIRSQLKRLIEDCDGIKLN